MTLPIVGLLTEEGLQADEAGNYQVARQVYAHGKFDAMILDDQLGVGSGIEFCRQPRQADPTTPVFLFTAEAD